MPQPLKFTDDSPMPFGKHEGKKLVDLPASYLLWLYGEMEHQQNRSPTRQAIFDYIEENMSAIESELSEERR